jgi:hypothetical protein
MSEAVQPIRQLQWWQGEVQWLPCPLYRAPHLEPLFCFCIPCTGLASPQEYTGGDGGPGVFLGLTGTSVCYAGEVMPVSA